MTNWQEWKWGLEEADGNLNWKANQSSLQLKRLGKKHQTVVGNESFRHNKDEITLAKSQVVIKEGNCLKTIHKVPISATWLFRGVSLMNQELVSTQHWHFADELDDAFSWRLNDLNHAYVISNSTCYRYSISRGLVVFEGMKMRQHTSWIGFVPLSFHSQYNPGSGGELNSCQLC